MSDAAEILDEAASKLALHDDVLSEKEKKQKAGRYEVLGETLAKFEVFSERVAPLYSRFLDVDKVDLVLRRRRQRTWAEYREDLS